MVKRFFDFTVACLGLLILSPVLLIAALVIKLTSLGPVFFCQERVGRYGKKFKLVKFRTMVNGAENKGTGPVTIYGDPRVTRIGEFLRRWKLDEIPTLWNVVKGEMSLVGPRPTVKMDVEKMDDKQRYRHSVLPGLTGLAQINGNTSLNWPERIKYDLEYIKKRSLMLDLVIIIKTIIIIITRDIETHPKGNTEWQEK
ncbi:MAG: sugar transferase [Bacteroidetes bacterium]|nr:sugar transferase [Bacteroidota bacterium]